MWKFPKCTHFFNKSFYFSDFLCNLFQKGAVARHPIEAIAKAIPHCNDFSSEKRENVKPKLNKKIRKPIFFLMKSILSNLYVK